MEAWMILALILVPGIAIISPRKKTESEVKPATARSQYRKYLRRVGR